MEQATFSEWERDAKKRRTRREKFLGKVDGLIPWERLERRVEPFYPQAGPRGGGGGPGEEHAAHRDAAQSLADQVWFGILRLRAGAVTGAIRLLA